jgi:osmotically inducible protein OsmC
MAEAKKRTAGAVWQGDLRQGKGLVGVESGIFQDKEYTFGTRFQDEPGTNPEELIAAAHAACYSMALALTLAEKGYDPQHVETEATCTVAPQDGGFKITKMHLQVRGKVPGLDEENFREIAHEADQACPVSNLLRPGLETLELEAQLA